jgi:hypothetical protein
MYKCKECGYMTIIEEKFHLHMIEEHANFTNREKNAVAPEPDDIATDTVAAEVAELIVDAVVDIFTDNTPDPTPEDTFTPGGGEFGGGGAEETF